MRSLFFIFLIAVTCMFADGNTDASKKVIQFEVDNKEETEDHTETNEMNQFLINEIIPAFGGFKEIIFSQKPSFSAQFTNSGLRLNKCSLSIKLKQLEKINYPVADLTDYGFEINIDIGELRWLFLDLSCTQPNSEKDIQNFQISFSIKDENLQPSYYSIKLKNSNQEQLQVKLTSIEAKMQIQTFSQFQQFFLSPYGDLTQYSKNLTPYLNKNSIYQIPISLWNPDNQQLKQSISPSPNTFIELKKLQITQIIQIKGLINLLFPTSIDGVEQENPVEAPFDATIFVTSEGEHIPMIHFSMD